MFKTFSKKNRIKSKTLILPQDMKITIFTVRKGKLPMFVQSYHHRIITDQWKWELRMDP